MMKLYKWLIDGNKPAHGGKGKWGLPKRGKPGRWLKIKGQLVPCHHGLHLCREGDLLRWMAQDLYEAEYRGELIKHDDKVVVREARLLKRLDGWNEQGSRLFACDCAERALETVDNPDPRSVTANWTSRACAFGLVDVAASEAAAKAAGVAARDTAQDAAQSVAARAAAYAASATLAGWVVARAAARTARAVVARADFGVVWEAECGWQTVRLLAYARGEVDLNSIKAKTEVWLKANK